jgi:hypothetical protein
MSEKVRPIQCGMDNFKIIKFDEWPLRSKVVIVFN